MKEVLTNLFALIVAVALLVLASKAFNHYFSRFGKHSKFRLVFKRTIDGVDIYVVTSKINSPAPSERRVIEALDSIGLAPAEACDMERLRVHPQLLNGLFISAPVDGVTLTLTTQQRSPHSVSRVSSFPLAAKDCYACITKSEADSRRWREQLDRSIHKNRPIPQA
ncbi:MAG TPA: hypothetical protein VHE10_03265 [Candidatus Paceibacterota bacterium]|nr:hypothetical protein [Candidatus Paceibacterota bacterium]